VPHASQFPQRATRQAIGDVRHVLLVAVAEELRAWTLCFPAKPSPECRRDVAANVAATVATLQALPGGRNPSAGAKNVAPDNVLAKRIDAKRGASSAAFRKPNARSSV
jgi:hypothetical protein